MKIRASGASMFPTLLDGHYYDMIIDEDLEFKNGDIIAFCVNKLVVCHRIVDIRRSKCGKVFYKTKGDNCSNCDPWAITPDMILGIVRE